MTIRKGAAWGEQVSRPDGLVMVSSDAEIAVTVARGDPPPLLATAGDVARSLGWPTDRPTMQRVPMDLLAVAVDGVEHIAAAHVLARRSWWRGVVVAAMNVDQFGEWNVAPRGHPNDGRFDVIDVEPSMSVRDRLQARRRLPQGTHVPHPDIATASVTARAWTFARPTSVWIDGVAVGKCLELTVTIRPDAYHLHV